jgi:hypothetical protein
VSVAVIACLYGTEYDRFVDEWFASLGQLERQPDEIILHRGERLEGETGTQARLQNEAAALASSEWIWKLDVDDLALPTALNGIDYVVSDVWVMGYRLENGDKCIPEVLPNSEYLDSDEQLYPGMSAFQRDVFEGVGGYPEIAYEDWGLWRRMARAGCTFESSHRAHSTYRKHRGQRTVTELVEASRETMLREMMADG